MLTLFSFSSLREDSGRKNYCSMFYDVANDVYVVKYKYVSMRRADISVFNDKQLAYAEYCHVVLFLLS